MQNVTPDEQAEQGAGGHTADERVEQADQNVGADTTEHQPEVQLELSG